MFRWILLFGMGACAVEEPVEPSPVSDLPTGVYRFSSDAFSQPLDDLAPLSDILANADVVGVGESIHYSGGFHKTRARVIKKLIAQDGFRIIALEGNWQRAYWTQRYLQTCDADDFEFAMGGLTFGVWVSPANAELLRWTCSFNQAHPDDPVLFIGVDVQEPWADTLLLAERWPDEPLTQGLSTCVGWGMDPNSDPFADPVISAFYDGTPIAAEDTRACLQGVEAMQAWAADQPDNDLTLFALESLKAGQQMMTGTPWWSPSVFEPRDAGMAAMLLLQRERRRPGARTIYLAHNVHIMANALDAEDWVYPEPSRTAGSYLYDALGDGYAAVGFGAHQVAWDWAGQGVQQSTSRRDSVERRLYDLDEPYLLVDTRAAVGEDGLIAPEERLTFGQPQEITMSPGEHFRAILYAERSEAMVPWQP